MHRRRTDDEQRLRAQVRDRDTTGLAEPPVRRHQQSYDCAAAQPYQQLLQPTAQPPLPAGARPSVHYARDTLAVRKDGVHAERRRDVHDSALHSPQPRGHPVGDERPDARPQPQHRGRTMHEHLVYDNPEHPVISAYSRVRPHSSKLPPSTPSMAAEHGLRCKNAEPASSLYHGPLPAVLRVLYHVALHPQHHVAR